MPAPVPNQPAAHATGQPVLQADGVLGTRDFVNYTDNAAPPNVLFKVDQLGNLIPNMVAPAALPAAPAAATATITSGTIPSSAGVARSIPAAAITGVIIAPGIYMGQELTVINTGLAASSITMAAAGTSNVADGVSSVIAGLNARKFVWDSVAALWYPVK